MPREKQIGAIPAGTGELAPEGITVLRSIVPADFDPIHGAHTTMRVSCAAAALLH